jgi:DNA-binding GntR family transcriptional regulator
MRKPQTRRSRAPQIASSRAETAGRSKRFAPIPRQSLAEAVLERLREQILNGELREGEQLRQDAIAAEFQISRIPVREALSHLAAEGLITIVANRGAVVSSLAPEEIEQLFETRAVLECYMLRQAIPNLTEADFGKAEAILKQYEESREKDSEIKNWGDWNWSFHSTLYAPANRPLMMSYIKTLNNNCDRYTRLHLLVTRAQHLAGKAHHDLLDACRSWNPDIASIALWKHITDAGTYLKKFIQKHRGQLE